MKFEIVGHLSDVEATWRAVADTDWMNREAGNSEVVAMDVQLDEHDYPQIHGALAGPLGTRLVFTEDDNRWVKHRFFRQGRTYTGGPLSASIFEVTLTPEGDGVIPSIKMELIPRNLLLNPIVLAALRRIRARWYRVLASLPAPAETTAIEPLRTLGGYAVQVYERLAEQASSEVVERLRGHLECGRPLELQQMRAFELADLWGLDREAVLETFLRGANTGLVELYWSVRCPRCSAQTASTTHLGNLADHANCASCRIGFDADLSTNVEVLFAPHPSIVERVDESFCTLFPMATPSIEASFILEPGAQVREQMSMAPGSWRIGSGGQAEDVRIEAGDEGLDALTWVPGTAETSDVRAGAVDLHLENPGAGRVRVQVARVGEEPPAVSASYLTTLPEFRRTMGHQVLATDIRISTRSVSIVFTDLTDSTAMYEQLGDARAFALVRDHFTVLRKTLEAHNGVLVKTIGDAVMAAFHDPGQAMEGALRMMADFDEWIETQELDVRPRLKVGLHAGPALVVHTDASGLDYFGQTVNIAARAQGVAAGRELVFTEACAGFAGVQRAITTRNLEPDVLEASLKGLTGVVRLHRVRVT